MEIMTQRQFEWRSHQWSNGSPPPAYWSTWRRASEIRQVRGLPGGWNMSTGAHCRRTHFLLVRHVAKSWSGTGNRSWPGTQQSALLHSVPVLPAPIPLLERPCPLSLRARVTSGGAHWHRRRSRVDRNTKGSVQHGETTSWHHRPPVPRLLCR
jgi:hypothetical protein